MGILANFFDLFWGWADYGPKDWSKAAYKRGYRFPPPWSVEEQEACFVVLDNSGRALARVDYEEEPDRRSAANLLTKDEARRIAADLAKLPKLLRPRE
jgi:hypothetical protein